MTVRVAINGFGRIGRMVFRRLCEQTVSEVVAINASYPVETLAHLTQYDTVHGTFRHPVTADGEFLCAGGQRARIVNEREPDRLPWKALGVDVVIEATGQFRTRQGAARHLAAGAKKVLITAPGKEEDLTVVVGVNDHAYDDSKHHIVSNASCTTNCLAPAVKVLHDSFGVEQLMMTTVHAFTSDQRSLDNPHKDLRRARAATQAIVPTSTGAAEAVAKVLPELEGRLTGMALRVPTPNVSVVDVVADLKRDTDLTEIVNVYKQASAGEMKGIVDVCEAPLVSTDFVGNDHSAILDAGASMMLGKRKVKLLLWYDNEWGYSCRVVDMVQRMAGNWSSHSASSTSSIGSSDTSDSIDSTDRASGTCCQQAQREEKVPVTT
ncbi:type I glyceraldehyde-3-phosphate dehydrogenase [Numidum massiliense]|uniref:type I glyceraldehyde-3-phosphate dehydrogenase n=1 Tax=Numidum massiliense TaxID=1522315 RepID=UPI00094052BD|nr:type I glyceraldehyde-3-phosphate dehydrogenase [Numidum massiliense]